MLSMTGFGTGRAATANGTLSVQVASVNHRGSQVQVRSELRDLALEELVRQEVRAAAPRGSVTVQVQFLSSRSAAIDLGRVAATWRELAQLATELGAPPPALERVAALSAAEPAQAGAGHHEAPLRAALVEALAGLSASRRREGAALAAAFRDQAARLRALIPGLRSLAAARLASYRTAMLSRLREVLAGQAQVDQEHLVRELALHSDRIDITEELVRLDAHLDALDALIASADDQLGRKLEFLLQELGREINTTGAKSNDAALTALVLEAKALLEQMREQAANVA